MAHEGRYLKEGDPIFALADFSQMWFVFDAYLPWLRVGGAVHVTAPALPRLTLTAPITFIDQT